MKKIIKKLNSNLKKRHLFPKSSFLRGFFGKGKKNGVHKLCAKHPYRARLRKQYAPVCGVFVATFWILHQSSHSSQIAPSCGRHITGEANCGDMTYQSVTWVVFDWGQGRAAAHPQRWEGARPWARREGADGGGPPVPHRGVSEEESSVPVCGHPARIPRLLSRRKDPPVAFGHLSSHFF